MADTKTSDETAAAALDGTEIVRIVQGAANRRTTSGKLGSAPDTSYAYAAPTTGQTVTMAAAVRRQVINPAGTLATLTIELPPTPVDGQLAGAGSTQIITALTVSGVGGASVVGAVTTLAVGGTFNMIYRASGTTWYPAP